MPPKDFFRTSLDQAVNAYAITKNPTLTEQLLYAILAQLAKVNEVLEELSEERDEMI